MNNWKTTLCGLVSLIGANLALFFPQYATLGGFLAAVASGAGLLFARDHDHPDDSSGAVEISHSPPASPPVSTTRQIPGALAALLAAVLSASLFCGCANPRAAAFNTLSDVRAVVDKAERVYGDQVALGRITTAQQEQIDSAIVQFHAAFLVAVNAARADYTTPISPDLARLADSLVRLIYTFTPTTAPRPPP